MRDITKFPPSWCPDAIPSDRGWRHPKTGELLVAVKGGVGEFRKDEKSLLVEIPKDVETISETIETPIIDENIKSEKILIDEEPQKEVIAEVETLTKTTKRKKTKNV